MGSRPIFRPASTRLVISLATVLLATGAWAASTTKVIHSFGGGSDGAYLDTELVRDSAGNLYGTSVQGGTGSGTVFQVTPAGVHTVLYSFTGGADGGEPYKGVTLDAAGNLYGTTVTGGGGACEGGCGVIFKLTNNGGTWTQSIVYAFQGGNDGYEPGSPVAFDSRGNLYGTTPLGGKYNLGVVYRISPNGTGGWNFRVIHTFTGGVDGGGGSAGKILIDSAGHLFGVCTVGGVNGFGTVYAMALVQGKWIFKTLYAFNDQPDGALPYGSVVADKFGNLYGTTYYAGANDWGTVYKLTRSNGAWTETVLYSFQGGTDGAQPISSLVSDGAGHFYGTTSAGGSSTCGCGVIFEMFRNSAGQWSEKVRYRFPGAPNAGQAYNGMVSDAAGNFYGATVHGGSTNDGAIYQFTP